MVKLDVVFASVPTQRSGLRASARIHVPEAQSLSVRPRVSALSAGRIVTKLGQLTHLFMRHR